MNSLIQFLKNHRRSYWPYLFLAGCAALFFWPTWIAGHTFPRGGGDLWEQLYPVWSYTAGWLRKGIFSLWSTRMMAGDPIIAESQYGLLNPLNWWMFAFSPIPRAVIMLRGILPLFLAGAGLYSYLRHSHTWRLTKSAALFGAVAYMFCDPFITHLGHPHINDAMAWLPWCFLAIDQILTRKRFSLLASLPLALLGMSGHYQMALYGSVAIMMYAAWQILRLPPKTWLHHGGRLVLVGICALALAAPSLLPSIERYPLTERAALQLQLWRGYQWPLEMAVDFITPNFHGRGVAGFWGEWARVEGGYIGAVALYLAVLGLATQLRKPRTWFLIGLGTLALLFSLGYDGPLYPWLARIDLIARIGKTARIIYLVSFVLAIAAAQGVDALLAYNKKAGFWALGLLGCGLVLWFGAPQWTATIPTAVAQVNALHGLRFAALLAAGTALLGMIAARGQRQARAALLCLLLAEVLALGSLVESEPAEKQALGPHADAIAYLQSDPGWFRVDVDAAARGLFSPAVLQHQGFEVPQGSGNPMELLAFGQFYWAVPHKGAPAYQLFGSKYIVVPKDALPGGDGIWPVYSEDPLVDIHLNTNALTRIWLVYDTHPVTHIEDAYAEIFAPDFAPQQVAVIEGGPDLDTPGNGTLEVLAYGPNRVRFGVHTSDTALLVLSDIFYPGWQATLDGQATEIYKTDGIFRGVIVPPGSHSVEMYFFPSSLKIGLGLVLMVGWGSLVLTYAKKKRVHRSG